MLSATLETGLELSEGCPGLVWCCAAQTQVGGCLKAVLWLF